MSFKPADQESLALRSCNAFPAVATEVGLEPRDFAVPEHRAYFTALAATRRFTATGSAPILDVATRAGLSPEWADAAFRYPITDRAAAREYARALREAAVGERFRASLTELGSRLNGLDLVREVSLLAKRTETENTSSDDLVTLALASERFVEEEGDRITAGRPAGISTGFPTLDRAIIGWRPGELTVLVGSGSAGKSTFAMQLILTAARAGHQVAVFSGEMTPNQLGERQVHSEAAVPLSEDIGSADRLHAAFSRLRRCPELGRVHIDHRPQFNQARTRSVVQSLRSRFGQLGLIVVDHLRHLKAREAADDYLRLAAGVNEAKDLATETNTPVLVLAHMNAEATHEIGAKQNGGEPRLSMVRGGPLIHDVTDNMLALWCPQQLPSLWIWKARQRGRAYINRRINLDFDFRTQVYREIQ